jgi:hypothetical protein
MLNPSSIFSFDRIKKFAVHNRVPFLTLSVLISIRFVFYCNQDWLAKIPPQSDLLPILSYLENDYQGEPRVLFFGSSRFISAIKSDIFAERMGLNSMSVLNLAIQSAGPWEALTLSRQNPSLLKSAKVAVIEVEPWMFNSNRLNEVLQQPSRPRSHFYRWASWQERLEIADFNTRIMLIFNFLWPVYERRSLKDWMFGISSILEGSHGALAVPQYHYDMEAARQLTNDPHFSTDSAVKSHMNNYEFAKNEANNLRHLRQLLGENSVEVILIQPPVRQKYMEAIYQNPEYLAAYKKYLSFIQSLENDNTCVIIWEKSGDIDLDDTAFVDYGHFNSNGAESFTEAVFKEILEIGGKQIFQKKIGSTTAPW